MISMPRQQRAPICVLFCGLAAMRTMAARMQRSRADERLARGPCARRRLDLHALLPGVLLRLRRSCAMPPGPADAWREPADLLRRGVERGRGTSPCHPAHGHRARSGNDRGVLGVPEWVVSSGAGRAGAGACDLCVAGSYQTGSGSSRSRAEKCGLGVCSRARWIRCLDWIDVTTAPR